jgi:hypothetical protein
VPSSLIFAGLVATWLAVLVPMAARRRQQTPRPSDAALAGRVLRRPRRRNQEVTTMDDATPSHTLTGSEAPGPSDQSDGPGEHGESADRGPGAPRYRPGRGGYDPEAAALAARARYTFRQRMVLVLVLFAGISAALAVTLRMSGALYLHAAVDLSVVGYLAYLRRQVRMERAIRARRAARGAGSRRACITVDPRTGEQPKRDRASAGETERRPSTVAEAVAARESERRADAADSGNADRSNSAGADHASDADDVEELVEQEPALPRLRPTPLPAPPPGTVRLELDEEDPELHDLAEPRPRGYRRAAGQ